MSTQFTEAAVKDTAQRDALIPKLISGKFRVSDVELHYKEKY